MDKELNREIYTDMKRVKQVLLNLMQNALKFTHEGSITVNAAIESEEFGGAAENMRMMRSSVDYEEKGIRNLRINVTDTGIGIDNENVKFLF